MIKEMNFHHIGYAVTDLNKSIKAFEELGFKCSKVSIDNIQNIRIAVLNRPNHPLIELIAPKNKESPIDRFLRGQNASPYHIAYTVKNFNEAISSLRKIGFVVTMRILPAVAFEKRDFIFLFKEQVGLIELIKE